MIAKANRGPKASRSQRVAGQLQAELMELLLRGGVRDPAVADLYVTNLTLTADLRHAHVYFRLTRPSVSDKDRENALAALNRAHGHLRRELGPRLQLQYMPDFKFFWDEGVDHAARVDAVLDEIRRDERDEPDEEGGQ